MGIKHYDKQFKERAVKLSKERDNISAVSRELGISSSQLTKWRKDYHVYGTNSFPGRGVERLTDEQREIKELKNRLIDRDMDVEILKKAIAFFSRAEK
jgi:transposase